MTQRTRRSTAKRKNARRRFRQGFGQTVFYAATTVLASELVRALLRLFPRA